MGFRSPTLGPAVGARRLGEIISCRIGPRSPATADETTGGCAYSGTHPQCPGEREADRAQIPQGQSASKNFNSVAESYSSGPS